MSASGEENAMVSNRQTARARGNVPLLLGFAAGHNHGFGMQSDSRTDMPRDSIQGLANFEGVSLWSFDKKVLFAMHDELCVWNLGKMNSWMGIFGSDGFVPKVQADPVGAWFAHYAGQDKRRMEKLQVGQARRVAIIPKHACSGTAIDFGLATSMKWEGWSAARHNPRD